MSKSKASNQVKISRFTPNGVDKGWKKSIGKNPSGKPMMWYFGKDETFAQSIATSIKSYFDATVKPRGGQWTEDEITTIKEQIADHYKDAPSDVVPLKIEDAEKTPESIITEPTVGHAIDVFIDMSVNPSARSSQWKSDLATRVKCANIPDVPLSSFGYDVINNVLASWVAKAKSEDCSASTSKAYIGAVRQFIKWLDRTDQFPDWIAPRYWEEVVTDHTRVLGPMIKKSVRQRDNSIELADLHKLYQGTDKDRQQDRQRLYILCGLNFGWTQVDIATLTPAMIHLDERDPYIERDRSKTGIYAKWYIWDETRELLKSELSRWDVTDDAPLLLTQYRQPLKNDQTRTDAIRLVWESLRKRVGVEIGGFKILRKFSGQLIRDIGGAEYAEAFLAHAPVSNVADAYHQFQDWDGLADAIKRMRVELDPMFTGKGFSEQSLEDVFI